MLLLAVPVSAELTILPAPREIASGATISLAGGLAVVCQGCDAEDTFAAQTLTDELLERRVNVTGGATPQIRLVRALAAEAQQALRTAGVQFTAEMQEEGYAIVPSGSGLMVVGATAAGVFYGSQTAVQMVTVNGPAPVLQTAVIRDWPALRWRGLSDDLSRGPVPTLEFQKRQIRTLAAYKVNLYSPYFEHTMQYASDPLMAPPGGSMTVAEVRELVAYAAKFHVTVVPEQEAFGHLHYLLNWELYAPLAETPHGNVLAPGQPASYALTKRMFEQLAQIFPGPFLHIGADETVELGKGQTKAEVDARGLGPVYLDSLQRIAKDLAPLHRKLLFWGDIAQHEPELLKQLPAAFKRDTIAVAWEYNPHTSFAPYIRPFVDAGMECWVAPGVNDWSRVYPNNNLALANIQQFTAQGEGSGCTGQLNTIWNDDGESLVNASWYGVLFGAEAAWHRGESSIPRYEQSYGQVFHGDATGKIDAAQGELMAAHALLKDQFKLSDASDLLFWLDPWSVDGQRYAGLIRPVTHDLRLHAERAIVLTAEARGSATLRENDALDALDLGARRMDLIGFKFQVTDEMASLYARAYALQGSKNKDDRMEVARSLGDINNPNGKLQDMRNSYSLMRDLYEQAWLKSYRPYALRNVLEHYDATVQMWLGRSDRLRSAQRQWQNSQTVPPAAEIGVPAPSATPVQAR